MTQTGANYQNLTAAVGYVDALAKARHAARSASLTADKTSRAFLTELGWTHAKPDGSRMQHPAVEAEDGLTVAEAVSLSLQALRICGHLSATGEPCP
jgi:hypothetical protein